MFGDFNTVLSPTVDRRGGAPCARADGVSRDLRSALAAGDFVDVYRRFFPPLPVLLGASGTVRTVVVSISFLCPRLIFHYTVC